jgi:hypothetical protein
MAMVSKFEQAHAAWLGDHLARRTGERRGRLERGHRHGEKLFTENIWWELKGSFAGLCPEYEVLDWRGKSYFADFVFFLSRDVKFIIEIKGFNSHVKEMDRQKFCGENRRELFLQSLGYRLISIAYDDVESNPDLIIALLRMLLSLFEPSNTGVQRTVFEENEVIRLAYSLARPIKPMDIETHFSINHRTAIRILNSLCHKGRLNPVSRGMSGRRTYYELTSKQPWNVFSAP